MKQDEAMIVARAPLRVPFAGGLTDLQPYAERFGGVTISSTIAPAAWVTLLPSVDGEFEVHSPGAVERAATLDELENDLAREALRAVDPHHPPVRLSVWLDVGGRSGVGSSGAITVALIHAAHAFRGDVPSAATIGAEAAHVEVVALKGASGYHDANISARGGLQRLDYRGAEVASRPVAMSDAARAAFEGSLLLFATGWQAATKPSLQTLAANLESALPVLHEIKEVAVTLERALNAGDLKGAAFCIGEQQRLKQLLPGNFVDDRVRELTARVAALGASAQLPGGKISGYLLVCCPDGQQAEVRAALSYLREVPLTLTHEGSVAHRFRGSAAQP